MTKLDFYAPGNKDRSQYINCKSCLSVMGVFLPKSFELMM